MIIVFKYSEKCLYSGYHNIKVVQKTRDAKLIKRITTQHKLVAVFKSWHQFRKFKDNYNLLSFSKMMEISINN
jgi:hypothetical protein